MWPLLDNPAFLQRKRSRGVELDFVFRVNEAADETVQLERTLIGKRAEQPSLECSHLRRCGRTNTASQVVEKVIHEIGHQMLDGAVAGRGEQRREHASRWKPIGSNSAVEPEVGVAAAPKWVWSRLKLKLVPLVSVDRYQLAPAGCIYFKFVTRRSIVWSKRHRSGYT